jgi:hypothetical protein
VSPAPRPEWEALLARALDERIAHQEGRVLARARQLVPHLTAEDIKNPDDYPELRSDPEFNYELGTWEGYCGARLALAATFRAAPR